MTHSNKVPKMVTTNSEIFIGGLHGSGGDIIPELLDQHPAVGTMRDAEEEAKEGELFQSVFEHEDYFGGEGAFAFHPDAHFDSAEEHWTDADLADLRSAFGRMWEDDAEVGVEYSPANITRSRLLAEAFPNSVQLYVYRHPVLDGLETRERTQDKTQPLGSLVRHWLYSHELLLQDTDNLENCFVVSFHELRRRPNEVLKPVFEAAGLSPIDVDATVLRSVGREGWASWLESTDEKRETVEQFKSEIRRFGYSLDEPIPVESPATEEIIASPTSEQVLRPDTYDLPTPQEDIQGGGTILDTVEQILIVSFGTRGDVQPCIGLAREFRNRGYDVRICSNETHRELVERYSIPFVSPHPEANIQVPIGSGASEKVQMEAFFDEVATFYDRYGTDIIETITEQVDWADSMMIGTGVFFRGLLYNHFDVPVVDIRFSPLYVDGDDTGEHPGINNFFDNIMKMAYAAAGFNIDEALDTAYETLGIPYQYDDEDLITALPRIKNSLILWGYSPQVSDTNIPGIPSKTTGFWQIEDTMDSIDDLTAETQNFLTEGAPPICLTFGSASIFNEDDAPWTDNLLDAIRQSEYRCIAIGSDVPDSVRTWAYHVDEAPHSAVFPHCRTVIHHGGAGTTAACMRSGTPAIIVPPVTWADMPQWADWVEREGAGIHVQNPEDGFNKHLERIEDSSFQECATAVAADLNDENGVKNAVDAFEEHFESQAQNRLRDRMTMRFLDSLPIAPWRKLTLSGISLFNEPDTFTDEIVRRREVYIDTIEETARKYPIFKSDWPHKTESLDIETHDLPHETSKTEWWYFHTHLETEAGEELSLFSALFERDINGTKLAHVNTGAVEDTTEEYYQRSIGDPRAPDHLVPELSDAPATDYFKRAVREVYKKDQFPNPDEMANSAPEIPRNQFGYSLGDLCIDKDGTDYVVELDPGDTEDGFGFSLRFMPQKEPVRNLEDGVMRGVTNDTNMFYYSFTRMTVTGSVVRDGERESVSGSGWYDHEFGGGKDTSAALGGTHSWTWLGIQFNNGAELSYTTLTDLNTDERLHDDEVMYVSSDGDRSLHTAELEETRQWSSMKTFTEYGVRWTLSVPDLGLEVDLEATTDNQEFQTVIASPGYWEGRIDVSGKLGSEEISGTGICEQYGQGGDRSHYRTFLNDVSREVQRSVREHLPLEDISDEQLQNLIARDRYDMMTEGVDSEVFLDSIVRPLRTIVDRGGKGWRSMCLLLCADAVGGNPQDLQPILALPELLHTGSLMVDDVQDNSETRRGGPAAHEIYGEAATINSGTASYFIGEPLIDKVDPTDEQWLRLYQLHNLLMRGTHAGQGMDIHGWQHKIPECLEEDDFDPLWANLRATHRLKSALPAMVAARMGVVLSEGSREAEDIIGEYFFALGLAFQIVDDAINLRGYEHDLKEHAEDILEGKVTAPIVRAFQTLDEPEQIELYKELQADKAEMDIHRIIELVEGCGAVDWCHDYARELVADAWEPVDEYLDESLAKMMLRAFSWFVVDVRDY